MAAPRHIGRVTAALTAVTIAVACTPAASAALELGPRWTTEPWRLLTGHLTHWTGEHLLWDAIAFAAIGLVVEPWRRHFAADLACIAVAVSAAVLLTHPASAAYRGLSGVDSGLFALAAGQLWRQARSVPQRWLAAAAGLGLAGKVVFELRTGAVLFVDTQAFVPLPAAHAAGAAAGAALSLLPGWRAAAPSRAARGSL